MTPERWQQVDKLLEQALEQGPEGRTVSLCSIAVEGGSKLSLS